MLSKEGGKRLENMGEPFPYISGISFPNSFNSYSLCISLTRKLGLKNKTLETEDVAHWHRACLTCTDPETNPQHFKKMILAQCQTAN
jgi:hypothetical protein